MCELIDIVCIENEISNEIFRNLVIILYLLSIDVLDYELLIRLFELKLLRSIGYNLILDNCSICRKKILFVNYISLFYYGGVCDECFKEYGLYIFKGVYNFLRFLMNISVDKLYRLNLSIEVKVEIEKVIIFLILNNYVKKLKSLEMLKFIKE